MNKRVLFVRASSSRPEKDECFQAENRIAKQLATKFNLESSFNLGYEHVNRITFSIQNEAESFRALITHVPPNQGIEARPREGWETRREYYSRCYVSSLKILEQIKKIDPSITIIAYSGINRIPEVEDILVTEGPIAEIVSKSHPDKWEKDFEALKNALERYVR